MKLNKRIAITLSILTLMTVGAFAAVAQTRNFGRAGQGILGGQPPRIVQRLLDRASVALGLTDQQEAQIKAILEAEKPKVAPLLLTLKANREALQTATANGAFNQEQVQAIAAKQGQTLAALIVEKERVQSQVYAVLTPEQRAQAEQFRTRLEERLRRHFTE